MTGVAAFFVGLFCGGLIVWCWAMCREADEMVAIAKQFDDGLSQSMRRASKRAVRKLRQHESVDAARARQGLPPILFYTPPPKVDDPPEPWSI